MITKTGHTYFRAFTLLFVLGIVFGNLNYLFLGVFLLAFFLLGLNVAEPRDATAARTFSSMTPRVGDEVEVTVAVAIGKGTGFVEVYDEVPEIFELTKGSNVHLLWKALGQPASGTYRYTVRCTRRGAYEFPPTQLTLINPLRLRKAEPRTVSAPQTLVVRHKPSGLRRMREVRGIAKTQRTDVDIARIGSQSTDFEEIREYRIGDPLKTINWKATARQVTRGSLTPLVNKYEPEGKKAVYFFLDSATYMQAGSSIDNTFESVVKATTGVVKFFLDKGYKIGGQFFNARKDVSIYPDTGERQYYRVAQELAALEAGDPKPGAFERAVENAKTHLVQLRPLVIVISRPEIDFDQSLKGLVQIRRHTATTRRVRPILLINPLVYSAVAGNDRYAQWTTTMLRAENRSRYHMMRRMGITVVDWDPKKEDIGVRLMRQVRTR